MRDPSFSAARPTALPEHNLDLLRSIAVLAVLANHTLFSIGVGHAGPMNQALRWLGQAGVYAFFVHTALVLMGSLERDDAPASPGWVKRFYVRRAWRIYPLAWVVMALALLFRVPAWLIPAPYEAPTAATVATNALLAQNVFGLPNLIVVLWTLPLELQMYVLLPACYLVARRRETWPIASLVVSGVVITIAYMWATHPAHAVPGLWRLQVIAFAPCFLMGVLAYWLVRRRGARAAVLPAWAWPATILVAIALTGVAFVLWRHLWIVRIVFCAVVGLAIPLFRDPAPSEVTRVAHTIATYSYGLYLVHVPALRTAFVVLRDQPIALRWLACVAIMVVGSYVGYHAIEKPGIALGRRLLGKRRGTLAQPAPAPVR